MPGLDPNALHLVNGDIAAENLKQAISASTRLVVSRDVLSCGPVLPFAGADDWKQSRGAFWRSALAHDAQADLRPAQNGIWENLDRLAAAPRIYAWIATGNTDQFCLAFLLELLERLGADPGRLELIEYFQVPPSGRRVVQMGELDSGRLRMHPPPRALSMDDWICYRNAWRALSADDPADVQRFDSQNPQASPHLRQAVRHVLRRYPERASGLDFWDRQLLRNVRERGPRAGRVIGYTMGEHFDEGDLIGDSYLFWRLLRMASPQLPRPLLSATGDARSMQQTDFELTAFGDSVDQGHASSWPDNPLDYWAGGVHISSTAGKIWFNDAGAISPP